ncbi:hypothetical protein V5O48_017647 [Marasmius crinis-equi]|uniref:Uncharacterized protein n=1 Tax=Marasmius crinis-equi TaxID=585013 RepID=A0ABR3ENE9_9AGAR
MTPDSPLNTSRIDDDPVPTIPTTTSAVEEDDDIHILSPNELPIDIDALPSPVAQSAPSTSMNASTSQTHEAVKVAYHVIILHHRQCKETVTLTKNTTPNSVLADSVGHWNRSCRHCTNLPNGGNLAGIIRRFKTGVPLHAPYRYHGFEGIVEIAHKYRDRAETKRLGELNMVRKLVVRQKALSMHKKFLVTVGQGDYERVDRLIAAWMRRNGGIQSLMKMYEGAAAGKLRVFGYTEKDYLQQILNWRIGGSCLVDITHRSSAMPGISSVRAHSTVSSLIASPSIPTQSEVESNLITCFEGIVDTMRTQKVKHAVMMFDEICTTKRPRFDPITGAFIGICREDGFKTSLRFEDKKDLDQLMDDLTSKEVHMSTEATIAAVGLLTSNKSLQCARPVLISGTCKREKAPEHAKLIQTTIDGVDSQKHITGVRVVSLASDGESKREKALVQLTFIRNLSSSSPIFEHVGYLGLIDLQVGPDDITPDKDYSTSTLISVQHLRMVGLAPIHISSLFNPEDKQDVLLAFTLLKDIWSLPGLPPNEASEKPFQAETRDAIRVLGRACYYLHWTNVMVLEEFYAW